MQEDINKVFDRTNTWLMRLNIEKCKIMHIGKKNNSHNYTLSNYNNNERISLVKTDLESDLGILISKDLKFEAQVNKAASKANMSLGMLKSTFKSRVAIMWKKIYTTYVRRHLEYAISVWNPFLKGDIEKLEKIQHRATKISHRMKGLSYNERCQALNLTSLKTRRTRGDLIQKYKLINAIDELNWEFEPVLLPPRGGHRGYYERELIKDCDQRFYFFNNRTAQDWNYLTDEIVSASSTNGFKNKLDVYFENRL